MPYFRHDPIKVDIAMSVLLVLTIAAAIPPAIALQRSGHLDITSMVLIGLVVGLFVVLHYQGWKLQTTGFRFVDHDRCRQPVLYGWVVASSDARPRVPTGAPETVEAVAGGEIPGARRLSWYFSPFAGLHREGNEIVLTSLKRSWRCRIDHFTAIGQVRDQDNDHLLLTFGPPNSSVVGDRVAFRPRWSGAFGAGASDPRQLIAWALNEVKDVLAAAPAAAGAAHAAPTTPSPLTPPSVAGSAPAPYPREPFLTAARTSNARVTMLWLRNLGIFFAVAAVGAIVARLTGIEVPHWIGMTYMIGGTGALVLSMVTYRDHVPAWNDFACPACQRLLFDVETFKSFSESGRCPHCDFQALTP